MGILGPKTLNLQELQKMGLKVPPFYAVDAKALMKEDYVGLRERVQKELPCDSYAVRSSALLEDLEGSSQAGQFLTLLGVKGEDLTDAIQKIAAHAKNKLGSLEMFSVVVQEFIEPDFAGVFFTRDPSGGREWVLEYAEGRGERVVGGEVKPVQKRGYWNAAILDELPGFVATLKQFKKIEEHFGRAQDIEWCIKDGKWYFLQARPITTVSVEAFKALKRVDEMLPKGPFYYEKTEISEIAPRPDRETLEILGKIYGSGGPVQNVYQKYGVRYFPIDFLKVVGEELYVDKEAELHSLLPAYSYFHGEEVLMKPRASHFKGLWRGFLNLYHLSRLPLDFPSHFKALEERMKASLLGSFLQDYELIFEINLLSSVALSRLQTLLQRYPSAGAADVLQFGGTLFSNFPALPAPKNLVGNSLDLQDTSPFIPHIATDSNNSLRPWWDSLSSVQRKMLEKPLKEAVAYTRLREYARWLLVRHTNQVRPKAKREKSSLQTYLPKRLTSVIFTPNSNLQCLSSGQASGKLLTLEAIKAGQTGILYTKILSPDLVEHFDKIKGILSEEGGLLSHLAIMAREHGIPVISGVSSGTYPIGDFLHMDASPLKIEGGENTPS